MSLDALKSDRNPMKEAALAAIDRKAEEHKQKELEMEAEKREARSKAMEAERSRGFVPYSEHVALHHAPPPTRAWKDDAADLVLGLGSRFTELL